MTRDATAGSIVPVILSGGSGTRLWPVSRELYPKQFHALVSERTLLQETALRVANADLFAPPIILCNEEHRFIVSEQLREVGIEPERVILEPCARNTAPAAAVAALRLAQENPKQLLLLLPSDHVIKQEQAFMEAVSAASKLADAGSLVTFGIAPRAPETGYGYIKSGTAIAKSTKCFNVEAFVEKPDLNTAKSYIKEGDYYWNSGMFLFAAETYLAELERFEPKLLEACRKALDGANEELDYSWLNADAFGQIEANSIDYAVMERTSNATLVTASIEWSDVGSWSALCELGTTDENGNNVSGEVETLNTQNCLIRGEGQLIATIGVKDLVIVATKDALLVGAKDAIQDVKQVVERLRSKERPETRTHKKVYRPWGSFESVDEGGRFQVKRLIVKPGARLSLQKHHHRAEHWVVVSGTAMVRCGEKSLLLHENQSTYIPLGEPHRLENPGKVPLHVIEVQSGEYLGEDDIVRFADKYGRG